MPAVVDFLRLPTHYHTSTNVPIAKTRNNGGNHGTALRGTAFRADALDHLFHQPRPVTVSGHTSRSVTTTTTVTTGTGMPPGFDAAFDKDFFRGRLPAGLHSSTSSSSTSVTSTGRRDRVAVNGSSERTEGEKTIQGKLTYTGQHRGDFRVLKGGNLTLKSAGLVNGNVTVEPGGTLQLNRGIHRSVQGGRVIISGNGGYVNGNIINNGGTVRVDGILGGDLESNNGGKTTVSGMILGDLIGRSGSVEFLHKSMWGQHTYRGKTTLSIPLD